MNGRAGLLARGGVLCLIALLAVGYVRFNVGVDAAYATCREANTQAECECWLAGYSANRTIFTEAPVFGLVLGVDDAEFDTRMQAVSNACGMTA